MRRSAAAVICLLAITGSHGKEYAVSESELSQLPKLYHLDDYHKCLAEKDGIYCLAEFKVYSDVEDHPTYKLIEKYSQNPDLFNRTTLHRGYCLSTRCPGQEANLTARFEGCVDKWARYRHGLRARLDTLYYCQRHGQKPSNAPDSQDLPHRVFLYVVWALVLLNFMGTAYDLMVEQKDDDRFPLLRVWSIPRNWKRLTASSKNNDPSLRTSEPFDGLKVYLIVGAVYAHVGVLTFKMYHKDVRGLEKFLDNGNGIVLGALTTVTQVFVAISSFLTTDGILRYSQHLKGFYSLHLLILKRLVRILPVYLLVNGFAATWWTSFGDGPIWPLLVNEESAICRSKFWAIAGFLQNFFEPEKICLVQTWIIAVEMQLHICSLIICLLLVKYRRHAVKILSVLFLGTIALTIYVTFKNGNVPLYTVFNPETIRTMFRYCNNFKTFFVKPTNCVIMAATGMIMACVNMQLKKRKVVKRFVWLHLIIVPLQFFFVFYCYYLKHMITDPLKVTTMVTVERLITSISMMSLIYAIQSKSVIMNFFRWSPLKPLARMSMSVSMVHWCVNVILIATRTTLQDSSVLSMLLETLGTWTLSHLIAIPLCLMVEFPMQRFLEKLLI